MSDGRRFLEAAASVFGKRLTFSELTGKQTSSSGFARFIGPFYLLDQFVWRPVVAWSQRFTSEEGETQNVLDSWLWNRIRRTRSWMVLTRLMAAIAARRSPKVAVRPAEIQVATPRWKSIGSWLKRLVQVALAAATLFGIVKYLRLLHDLTGREWLHILASTSMTFLRVVDRRITDHWGLLDMPSLLEQIRP